MGNIWDGIMIMILLTFKEKVERWWNVVTIRESTCGYKAEYMDGKLKSEPKPMAANQVGESFLTLHENCLKLSFKSK